MIRNERMNIAQIKKTPRVGVSELLLLRLRVIPPITHFFGGMRGCETFAVGPTKDRLHAHYTRTEESHRGDTQIHFSKDVYSLKKS